MRKNKVVKPNLRAASLALTAVLSVPVPVHAQTRIMPLGNSITEAEIGFDAATDTYDGVHPNRAGEQKMSARWYGVLRWMLVPNGLAFRDDFESGGATFWSDVQP
jgi:hypothetical protein